MYNCTYILQNCRIFCSGFIFVSLLYMKDKSSIFYINGSNVPEYSKYLLTKKYLQQQCKVLPPIILKSLNISIYIIMCQCEFDYFVAWLSKRIPNKKKLKLNYLLIQSCKQQSLNSVKSLWIGISIIYV